MTPGSPLQVKVGGVWVGCVIGLCGDLTYSHEWPGGSQSASWTMRATYGSRRAVLYAGAPTQVWRGMWPLWTGTLDEPDWNGSEIHLTATGLSHLAEDYGSLDGSSNATDNAATAVAAAITRGLPYTLDASIPNDSLSAGNIDPSNTVSNLLTARALKAGMRWAVDPTGLVYMAADPTVPSWSVQRGAADLGIALDNYASNVSLRYADSASGTYLTATYPDFATAPNAYQTRYGHREAFGDITDWGPITAAYALNIATQVYTLVAQKPGYTNGLDVTADELLTVGGTPADLASVTAGQLVRVHGVPDEVALTPWTDFVIGDTEYAEGSATRTINPVGLVSRTTEDVLTELFEASGLGAAA